MPSSKGPDLGKLKNRNYRDLQIEGRNMTPIVKALSNEVRVQILEFLEKQDMNIQSIQKQLNISKTTVLMHLKILEKAGFISTYYVPGTVGHQKFCKKEYDRLVFNFTPGNDIANVHTDYYELNISPGNYFNFEVFPPCGLATKENVIIRWDDPSVFFSRERITASILWCSYGFVEYRIPFNIPFEDMGFSKMEITLELSSQGGLIDHASLILPDRVYAKQLTDGVSDITFWLNGTEVAEHQVIDEYKMKKKKLGKLTPHWWKGSQYGELICIEINHKGTSINGKIKSRVKLNDILSVQDLKHNLKMRRLMISGDNITFRIGIKKQAAHSSGFNIYGKEFGNYPVDISVKFYK
jgi:predicted transcriptional regulator